ncbi:uncharacterized protein A4U43_C04F12800 [Asparagus officinalis]|uniref:noroxomaritidine synthase n=1 Tax=Asparagus officinalis TaxID=4686 RepID=A0A5P1F338_ASPOF|nr:uncharacterized protein A4U43_C04F12800 [Asparagus officinalis]
MSRWVSRSIWNRFMPILQSACERKHSVDLQDLLLRLTFDNICGLAFGKDPETLSPDLPENAFAMAFDRATEASLNRFIFPEVVWRFKKYMRLGMETTLSDSVSHVDKYLSAVIKSRKLELDSNPNPNQDHDNLLSRFMRKGTYSDAFLQNVALNFILAGRDTSSVALSWFFWLVSNNPAVERKILAELCSVLKITRGENNQGAWLSSPLAFEEVDQLIYLKAALSRTLRLYPSRPRGLEARRGRRRVARWHVRAAGSRSRTRYIRRAGGRRLGERIAWRFKPERWLSPDGQSSSRRTRSSSWRFNGGAEDLPRQRTWPITD